MSKLLNIILVGIGVLLGNLVFANSIYSCININGGPWSAIGNPDGCTEGNKSWQDETRNWHVDSKGDTLVSYLNQEQADEFEKKMEKSADGTDDLVYDATNPMFGLVSYVPAHDTAYQTNTDWYGSGDVDGDGAITWDDYFSTVSGTDPFNDGTHRGDVNLDGVTESSEFSQDKQIMYEYLMGERNHINVWEFETETEQINHLEKALAIDPTSEISAGSSGWSCGNYMAQLFINTAGVYDIEGSIFAEPSSTNLDFDISHNGIFRIPLRYVSTKSSTGISHAINSVYLGNPENQDAKQFDYRIFIEPQNDEFAEIGDWDFNTFAKEKWYGYTYNEAFEEWGYGARSLINYDLTGPNVTTTFVNDNLMEAWNPFLKSEYPSDNTQEFPADTSVLANGSPANLYHGTQVGYSDESTQTSNGTCSDVSYNVSRGWELIAGAYNPGNTSLASQNQNIDVEDTTPPEVETMPNDTTITIYGSMHPDDLGWPTWSDNSALPLADSSYNDVLLSGDDPIQNWARYFTGTDVCGNEKTSEAQYINVDFIEGLEDKVKEDNAYVFPNPTNGNFNLHYSKPGNVTVGMYSLEGKLIEKKSYSNLPAGTNLPYNIGDKAKGIYLLKIQGEDGSVETEKIVNQ